MENSSDGKRVIPKQGMPRGAKIAVIVLAALVVQIVCLLSAGAVTWSAVAGMALVLAAAVFCGFGLLRIQRHMQRLRREREIHE